MNDKQIMLILYLLKMKKKVTASELAQHLEVSVRTIKSMIYDINLYAKRIVIMSTSRGYEINQKTGNQLLESHQKDNKAPQTFDQRAKYINNLFLLSHTKTICADDVCDTLFISYSTLRSDIQKMNKKFVNVGITYTITASQIIMTAEERDIRKLARITLFDQSYHDMFSWSYLEDHFEDENIPLLKQYFELLLSRKKIYINEFALYNVILHLAIIIRRVKEHNYLSQVVMSQIHTDYTIPIVEDICTFIEKTYEIHLSDFEYENIETMINTNVRIKELNHADTVKDIVGLSFYHDIESIMKEISQIYYIDFSSADFLLPFMIHIRNLAYRYHNAQQLDNPLSSIIVKSHPLVFDIAVSISVMIERTLAIKISQSETSFIAMHIGAEIERQRFDQEKIKTVLLTYDYLSTGKTIENQVLLNFSNELNVTVVDNFARLSDLQFDLLLTTIPVTLTKQVEVVQISPFKFDKRSIIDAIESINIKKQKKVLVKHFHNFFDERLFIYTEERSATAEEAIQKCCNSLLKAGNVEKHYFASLMEREAKSSTAFGSIAIPHSIHLDAIKSSCCVLIAKHPINWGESNVKLVLTLAFNREDSLLFRDFYEAMIQVFSIDNSAEYFERCTTFQEFKNTIEYLLDM